MNDFGLFEYALEVWFWLQAEVPKCADLRPVLALKPTLASSRRSASILVRCNRTATLVRSSSLSLDTLDSPRHGRPRLGPIDFGGHSAMMGTGHDVNGFAR